MKKAFNKLLIQTMSIFLLYILFSVTAFAQQKINVRGTVTDAAGEPLIGVNVAVKGTTTGIITDVDGNYALEAPNNSTLVFSYIGYKTVEIVANRATINVTMNEDTEQIDEVVVVGYGVQKKVTVTGAVASVTGEDLKTSPTTNLSNGMLGRMPGVIGFQRSDEPGGGATTIRIRGNNTLGSKDPLIVVDGVPDRSGGMNRINPNDIESMSVLKDAAASIYGSRAANGVILITTKKGKEGKANVQFTGSYGFSKPTLLPKMCNAFEYASMINEIQPGAYSEEALALFQNGKDPWGHPNTNWYKEVIKDFSPLYRGDLSISGGTDKVKYYVNFGLNGEDGIYKHSANRYDQYGIRSNLDFKLSKDVQLSWGSTARYEYTQYPAKSASSIFSALRRSKPTLPAYWPTGQVGPDIEYGDNPAVTSTDAAGYNHQKNYYIQNNVTLNINIPWIEGLKFTGTASYDKHFYNEKNWQKPITLYSWDGVTESAEGLTPYTAWISDPRLTRTDLDYTDWMANAVLSYDKTIGKHTFGIMAGIEGQSKERDYLQAYRRYFPSDTLDEIDLGSVTGLNNGGYSYKETRRNYFGRVNYNYMERYLFEFVWRYDGSYRFPKDNRYGFFPGVMAAWRVSEEPWFKEKVHWMDYLKIRASISQSGNDVLTDADGNIDQSIQYLNTYAFQSSGIIFNGAEQQRLYPSRTPNPNITWERGTTYDIGAEVRFFNNRLSIEGDYFMHKRKDMLITRSASLPQIAGFTLPRENIGKMQNSGFDALISWQDKVQEVGYDLSLNVSYAKNKVTYWDETPGLPEWQQATGHPIPTSGTYAALRDNAGLYYQADGVFNTQAELDSYPHWDEATLGDVKFVDLNNDGVIDWHDMKRSDKNQTPTLVMGFNVGANWKNFDLMMLFQAAFGAETYIQTWSGTVGNFLKEYYDQRWTAENSTSEHPRTYERENQYWINNANTMFLRNNDYMRLKNIEIGYTLPNGIKALGISKLRIFANGQNIFTITGVPGDPENTAASFDYYPQRQYYTLGVTANF
ncbi:SusC/RagA family TonB-linked outer membrane protein [Phocaeicola oris]|uniref:SusC/RagA family TonB-linked outer membrane protein n=1 Tax=Phocaeicola oris TaxID=2896850 RepID=UPI00234E8FF9|nr:TonB-dependent receptor [Phocaeicola oris]MCE2617424.1 TonB-dependent receptor [Phocaeicola oris]